MAWWSWAICLAVAASRTTNPFLLLLVVAVAGWVVLERHEEGASRIMLAFLALGGVAIVLRVAMIVLVGGGAFGTTVLFTLPEFPLPAWSGGLRIGGQVTAEELSYATYQALQLAAILACIGAANALASPRRLLRHIPATLYDVGTAIVVGLTFAPQLVTDARRVYRARQLRGRRTRGLREWGRLATPIAAGALEQSLQLAASMESRGYGSAPDLAPSRQRTASAVTVAGLVAVVAGLYGALDDTSSPFGVPLILVGTALASATLLVGAGHDRRTRYRPDPWLAAEWLVVGVGLTTAAGLITGQLQGWPGLSPENGPVGVPALPLPAVVAILLAGAAGALTPAAPRGST